MEYEMRQWFDERSVGGKAILKSEKMDACIRLVLRGYCPVRIGGSTNWRVLAITIALPSFSIVEVSNDLIPLYNHRD